MDTLPESPSSAPDQTPPAPTQPPVVPQTPPQQPPPPDVVQTQSSPHPSQVPPQKPGGVKKSYPWIVLVMLSVIGLIIGTVGVYFFTQTNLGTPQIQVKDQKITTTIEIDKLVLTEKGILLIEKFEFTQDPVTIAATVALPAGVYADFTLPVSSFEGVYMEVPAGTVMYATIYRDTNGSNRLETGEDFPLLDENGDPVKIEFRAL